MSKPVYCFGLHAIQSLLETSPERVLALYTQQGRDDARMQGIQAAAQRHRILITSKTKRELDKLIPKGNHQGLVALCKAVKAGDESDLQHLLNNESGQPRLFLVLDSIQDPHNLGACLRSADAAGVDAVIANKDRSVGITPVVEKVASGATQTVPFIQVTNLSRTLDTLKAAGIWCYGAAGEATQTLYETTLAGDVAIVMGAEGKGLRRLTREHCDELIKIPMQGSVSSLNVSVAAGICLFEVKRQQLT